MMQPVSVSRSELRPPIIIGGAPSTGSTLLRVLLGRHPSIVAGGEVGLLDKRGLFTESVPAFKQCIENWVNRGYPALFWGPSEVMFDEIAEYFWDRESILKMSRSASSLSELTEVFYGRAIARKGAVRWLDKCPANVYCFDLIMQLWPTARLIHIVRDGRDCVASYSRRGASPYRAVGRWFYSTLSGIRYRECSNYLEICYENLVENPQDVLKTICTFVDESYSDALTLPDENRKPPRHASWAYSQWASIGSGSIGNGLATLTQEQKSLFQKISVTPFGAEMLFRGEGCREIKSPVALQEYLGYSTAGLEAGPHLSNYQVARCEQEFQAYRMSISRRHGVYIENQLSICNGEE